jgi:hypothetical protein
MDITEDQRPHPIPFLCKKQIDFFPDICSRPKTKDQILISSIAKNNAAYFPMQHTKDQGTDAEQFFCKEQLDFFSDAADQQPTTRS